MSFVFSKNKAKRSRSPTGETNNSFVKNVTSRVSGFLPANITKWFSSPSSSGTNGSAPISDATDSSTEDEAPEESPIMVQPPAKRLRYASPVGKYSQLTTSDITVTSNVITESGSVLYNSIQSPPGRQAFHRETKLVSTPTRSHADDSITERSERDSLKSQHPVSSIGQSISLKRKSFFDSHAVKEASLNACAKTAAHTLRNPKQPHFKPHLLGSPFYPGQTMYGGASASSTYINKLNITQRKNTCVNESKDSVSVNLSSSTRQVMDLLENYSSPLIEAKRIPRYDQSIYNNRNSSAMSGGMARKEYSYKTQELYLPTQATIVRLQARNRLMNTTKAARQIIASHSSMVAPYPSYADASGKEYSLKVKSRLTRQDRSQRGNDASDVPETVELPNVVLQIDKDNLPKFTLNPTPSSNLPTFSPVPTSLNSDKCTNTPTYPIFTFSNPDTVITETGTPSAAPPHTFDFGSPVRTATTTSPSSHLFGGTTVTEKKCKPMTIETTETKAFGTSDQWKCLDCWVSNKAASQACVCCGAKQPSKVNCSIPSKCVVCKLADSTPNSDKCVNCEKVVSHTIPVTKAISLKWTCGDCWVSNDESAEKCVCCGLRNPKKGKASTDSHKQQPAEKDWRCPDCFITNKPSVVKCAACTCSKPASPSAQPISNNLAMTSDDKLKEIAESQKKVWECRVCLAPNPLNKAMCACCEAERELPTTSKYANFKFKKTPDSSYMFGINPDIQKNNIANKIIEMSKPKNVQESETNNNLVPDIPSYTFTMPYKKINDKVDDVPKTDEHPKATFSFGIPKQNATPLETKFIPIQPPSTTKLPNTQISEQVEEKTQEVPVATFTKHEPAVNDKPTSGLFNSLTPHNSSQASLSSSFYNNSSGLNKIDPSPSIQQAEPEKQKFSFSSISVKPSTSMFATVSNAVKTESTLALSNVPATTSAPIMSVFQNSATEIKTSEAVILPATNSVFSNSAAAPTTTTPFSFGTGQSAVETTPSAATPHSNAAISVSVPTADTQPKFSFGFGTTQNTINPAPAASTVDQSKKFNFNFGSTTTPTFGATQQPTTSNTFSLPTAPLASNGLSNALASNPLGTAGSLAIGAPAVGNMNTPNAMIGSGSGPVVFNAPAKEQMWPSTEQNNMNNPFMTNVNAKPAFSFGATPTTFGGGTASGAGANAQPVVFGASAQPAQSMFGTSDTQSSMFSSPSQSQPEAMFGNLQPANLTPMFASVAGSSFGSPAPQTAAFEQPSIPPAFNFGAPQSPQSPFGFGQTAQSQQMQQIQPSFCFGAGGMASQSPNVQFNMGQGGAPTSTAGRRVRKAVRRTTLR